MAALVRHIPVVEIGPLVEGARLGDVTASAAELEAAACLVMGSTGRVEATRRIPTSPAT